MNTVPEQPQSAERKIYLPLLQAGPTNEAFLKYEPTEVQVWYGRNSKGELVIHKINTQSGVSATDKTPTQPFPKYLQNPTTFSFYEEARIMEGETLKEFFDKVIFGGRSDIREITAATKLLMFAHQDKFEGVKDPEKIRGVYNSYYELMIHALNTHANNPQTAQRYPAAAELMKDLIEIFKANGPLGILLARQEAAERAASYTQEKESDEWMTTDSNGVYNGGSQEVLSFTHTGDLYSNGVMDPTKFKVGLNFEYVPATSNLQIILTGGGIQDFSNEAKHTKIFKGKDDKIDVDLKANVMKFHGNIVAAMNFLQKDMHVDAEYIKHFANLVCTVVMEVLQETGKNIIPKRFPELTDANKPALSALIHSFTSVDLKPNPDITTVTTSIIYSRMTGKVPNFNNTADEILDPLATFVNLEELLILIDQGIIEDERLIAATGIFLAKELYKFDN